jgi:hypothetical protein
MKYYLEMKKSNLLIFSEILMNLKTTMLSQLAEKNNHILYSYVYIKF